jgi:Lon protease-like protein
MIGMIQPLHATGDTIPDDAPLFQVGCAGRITAFAEADDERCLITLVGVTRFRIAAELPLQGGGYRRVAADASPFLDDIAADPGPIGGRDQLLAGAKRLFTERGFELDWRALAAAPDEPMVTALAMIAPLDVAEKQALLEARTLADRASTLTTMIDMANRSLAGPNAQPN